MLTARFHTRSHLETHLLKGPSELHITGRFYSQTTRAVIARMVGAYIYRCESRAWTVFKVFLQLSPNFQVLCLPCKICSGILSPKQHSVLSEPKPRQLAASISCCELYLQGKLQIVLPHGMHLNISGGNKRKKGQSILAVHKFLWGLGTAMCNFNKWTFLSCLNS